MTKRKTNSQRLPSGARRKLTSAQEAAVVEHHAAVKALGRQIDYLKAAAAEWRAKRRALGYDKQIAADLGLSMATLLNYKLQRHNHDNQRARCAAQNLSRATADQREAGRREGSAGSAALVHRQHLHGLAVEGDPQDRRLACADRPAGRLLRTGVRGENS